MNPIKSLIVFVIIILTLLTLVMIIGAIDYMTDQAIDYAKTQCDKVNGTLFASYTADCPSCKNAYWCEYPNGSRFEI